MCVVCQKSFLQSSHLKKHSKIHTDEKSYPCLICNKYFRRSDTLAIHKKIHEKQLINPDQKDIIINSQIIIPPIDVTGNLDYFHNQTNYQISYQIAENWNENQL